MSLGDLLRLHRARHAGVTPAQIEAALPELPRGIYRQMEQRYRAVGDDAAIKLLADFYGAPFEALREQLDWPRKALSRALVHAQQTHTPIRLELWNGETVAGEVAWWDLGALELVTADGALVVQRHAVQRWHPRAAEEDA